MFALSPARYWWGSIQWYQLYRLSGGVPAGSQDRGHHPYWRNWRQCWGECCGLSQTAQLCKKITLDSHYCTSFSLGYLCYSTSLLPICLLIKNSCFSEFALSHALSSLSAVVNTGNHHKSGQSEALLKCHFFLVSLRLLLLVVSVCMIETKSDRWDERMIHRTCFRNVKWWWAMNLFLMPTCDKEHWVMSDLCNRVDKNLYVTFLTSAGIYCIWLLNPCRWILIFPEKNGVGCQWGKK